MIGQNSLTDQALRRISKCKNLQQIDIEARGAVSEETVLLLAERCRKLKRVSILGSLKMSERGKSLFHEMAPTAELFVEAASDSGTRNKR